MSALVSSDTLKREQHAPDGLQQFLACMRVLLRDALAARGQVTLPKRHHMTQSEAMAYLGDDLFRSAVASGKDWLLPTAKREGRNGTVFFRTSDVEMISLRAASGELPPVRAARRGKAGKEGARV